MQPEEQVQTERRRPIWRDYLDVLVLSTFLALFARTFLVQAYSIPSPSMEPTLLVGDHVLVNRFVYAGSSPNSPFLRLLPGREVRRGELVTFRVESRPERDLLKRCIAVSGDLVELEDKSLALNGEFLEEPYKVHVDTHVYPSSRFLHSGLRYRDNLEARALTDGELFCLGDNRDVSTDSRVLGPFRETDALGRVFLVYWSRRPEHEEPLRARTRIGRAAERLRRLGVDTRWRRFLSIPS